MADPPRRRDTDTPSWVKVCAIIVAVLLLLITVLHFAGHGFGGYMRHMH